MYAELLAIEHSIIKRRILVDLNVNPRANELHLISRITEYQSVCQTDH